MPKVILKKFRFPVKQIGEREIQLEVPTRKDGCPVLHADFIETFALSIKEIDEAEDSVLDQIAEIK